MHSALTQELVPYFEKHYRAADFRRLIGVSGSSLNPIYNLTHAPDLFRVHILYAAADMIGMGYKPGETFVEPIEQSIADTTQPMRWLYIGAADSDTNKNPAYIDNLTQLETGLARHRGGKLTFRTDILADENHYAREALEKAVRLAGRYDQPNLSSYEDHLAEFNEKTAKTNL